MATKKNTKKRVIKKKTIKKRTYTKKKPVIKKPYVSPAKAVEVIKKLEAEVRRPDLGEGKGGDKKFIPQKKPFVKRPFIKKRFPDRRQFSKGPDLKSHGERQISEFLKEERIHFVYEYPLAITDEDRKVRIWYPDFWLPELNIIIEYMGMKGKGDYDKANLRKKKIYNALKIDFMEITPGLLVKGNWKRFIAMKIMSILSSKQHQLSKMKALASKYRIPAQERQVDLSVLDE